MNLARKIVGWVFISLISHGTLSFGMELQKIVVEVRIQQNRDVIGLLQEFLQRLSENQNLTNVVDSQSLRAQLQQMSFSQQHGDQKQLNTRKAIVEKADVENSQKRWVGSLSQLIIEELPAFEDPRDFRELIDKGKELLQANRLNVSFTRDSSVNMPVPKMEDVWPIAVLEAVYERCKIAKYTKLIIACELSGSGQIDEWIKKYSTSIEGKEELNTVVNDLAPLLSTAARGSVAAAHCLLAAGAMVNLCNSCGDMPIMFAACEDRADMINALQCAGAFLNVGNNDGLTPLHVAVLNNRENSTRALLEAKAQVCIRAANGRSPMETAIANNNPLLVKCLLPYHDHLEGNKAELQLALNELSAMMSWREKDVELEKLAREVFQILLEHPRTIVTENILAQAKKINVII